MAWANLDDSAALAEEYLKAVVGGIIRTHGDDLELLAEQEVAEAKTQNPGDKILQQPGLMQALEAVVECRPWVHISYEEALQLLQQAEMSEPNRFAKPAPKWGDDLSPEHERFICFAAGDGSGAGRPVIVRDYPCECKSFYMRKNDDGRTVAAMDVLFPRLAEVVGGGQREERLDLLQEVCPAHPYDFVPTQLVILSALKC